MADFDRQFEVVAPDLSMLYRKPLEVADLGLLDPNSTSPVPLIDGEFVQLNAAYKYIRATDTAQLSYATIEDRGDYGVQASRKLSALFIGGYEADTVVFDAGLTTLGAAVMHGDVTVGAATRRGLVAWTAAPNIIIGYVTRTAATNGGRLRFQQVAV